jgi:hypothetical protein
MTKEQTAEIERAVRKVLGDVLSDASDELSSSVPENSGGAGGEIKRSLSAPGDSEDDSEAIPPAVMEAVKQLCRDLSSEQARTLAAMFEAIGSQTEEEEPEEEEEEDGQEAMAAADAEMELGSEADAKAEGAKIARGGIGPIIKLLKKYGPKIFRAAVKAAKQGRAAFVRWVNSLSNFNPLKWAIKGLPSTVLMELISWLASQLTGKVQR